MTETREAPTPREVEIERIAAEIESFMERMGTEDPPYFKGKKAGLRLAAALVRRAGLRFPVPPDPGTAATDREARWPHRPTENIGPFCVGCSRWWPCPSQQYLDGIVAAARELRYGWTGNQNPEDYLRGWLDSNDALRALLSEPKP